MKRGRNLTRSERDHVQSLKLNPDNWLLSKKLLAEWHIIHRESGRIRVIAAN